MAAAGRSEGGDSGGYFRAWIGGGYSSFCLRVFSFVSVHVFGRRSVSPPHWSGGGGGKNEVFWGRYVRKTRNAGVFLGSPVVVVEPNLRKELLENAPNSHLGIGISTKLLVSYTHFIIVSGRTA